MANIIKTTFSLGSTINGKRLGDMDPEEMMDIIHAIGGKRTDVDVKDKNGELVAKYECKTGTAYYYKRKNK